MNNIEVKKPKSNFLLPLIILSNLFPLYGVVKFNWTIFTIVYIYWIELLIISFFQLLKIFISQGEEHAFFKKIKISFQFFLFRTFIFFFYLMFIFVFLGLLMKNDKDTNHNFAMTVILRAPFMKVVLLNFLVYNLVEFFVMFILSGEYKTSKPADQFQLFDSHMIVVHIVVVLGTFLAKFVQESLHADPHIAMIACVCLFIFVKILVDIARQGMNSDASAEIAGKYI
ncbi:MAG: hypothetical protein JWN78_212 [Bacteroidota bacterium]|nr:hypothetical protein [Bacteroidota bacterium]